VPDRELTLYYHGPHRILDGLPFRVCRHGCKIQADEPYYSVQVRGRIKGIVCSIHAVRLLDSGFLIHTPSLPHHYADPHDQRPPQNG